MIGISNKLGEIIIYYCYYFITVIIIYGLCRHTHQDRGSLEHLHLLVFTERQCLGQCPSFRVFPQVLRQTTGKLVGFATLCTSMGTMVVGW